MLGRLGTALVLLARPCSSPSTDVVQPAPDAGRAERATGAGRRSVAAQRQLLDRRRAGSGVTHGHRPQRRVVAQHQRDAHQRAAVSSLLERVAQHRLHAGCASGCAPAAGPAAATTIRPAIGRPATGATSTSPRSACSPAAPPRSPTSRPAAAFIAPDDGNRDDRTVLSVPLPGAVAPGESVTVELAWTARVPRTFARTGAVGNYFFIAQWFPKLGVLEDTRLEHAPVPRRHRVLRRLRRLRRPHHRAARAGWSAPPGASASGTTRPRARRRTATCRKTCTTSCGRPAPTTS